MSLQLLGDSWLPLSRLLRGIEVLLVLVKLPQLRPRMFVVSFHGSCGLDQAAKGGMYVMRLCDGLQPRDWVAQPLRTVSSAMASIPFDAEFLDE